MKLVKCLLFHSPIFIALCLVSCKSSKSFQNKATGSQEVNGTTIAGMNIKEVKNSPLRGLPPDEIPPIPPPPEHLPPNSCLIIGKVTQIQPTNSYGQTIGNCGSKPCFAKITVERVIQTGMGLTTNLSEGQEIILHFPNTLNGIETGKNKLASLSEQDRFTGLLMVTESNQEWAWEGMSHTIHKYDKL